MAKVWMKRVALGAVLLALPLGKTSGIVTIHTRHDTMPSLGLPIHVSVLSPVEVYPPKIVISAGEEGTAVGNVRLRHRLGRPLNIESVVLGPGLPGTIRHDNSSDDVIEVTYSVSPAHAHAQNLDGEVTVRFADEVHPKAGVDAGGGGWR